MLYCHHYPCSVVSSPTPHPPPQHHHHHHTGGKEGKYTTVFCFKTIGEMIYNHDDDDADTGGDDNNEDDEEEKDFSKWMTIITGQWSVL